MWCFMLVVASAEEHLGLLWSIEPAISVTPVAKKSPATQMNSAGISALYTSQRPMIPSHQHPVSFCTARQVVRASVGMQRLSLIHI